MKLAIKDLVLIGVMTVVMVVVSFAVSFTISPFLTFSYIAGAGVSSIFMSLPYFLMAYKIGKRGVYLVATVVHGIIYLLLGFPTMLMVIVPAGFICELIMFKRDSYRSFSMNVASWSLFSAIYSLHGAIMVRVMGMDYFRTHLKDMFSQDQFSLMEKLYFDPKYLLVIGAFGAVGGILGSILSYIMFKKHFVKAGVIRLKRSA